jgi:glucan 1,3-beta-glucosidase
MKFTVLILVSCSLLASVSADIFYGLNYGVSKDACPSYETVNRDFRILSQYTSIIRVYSVKDCNIGEMALKASQANRLKVYLGMWVDKTDSFDKELAALQQLVSSNSLYNVEAIIVGSEVMYREDMESSELVNHIEDVKRLVKPNGVQITTSDVYYKFNPDVVDAVDFVMM